jgi:hypothetical protein
MLQLVYLGEYEKPDLSCDICININVEKPLIGPSTAGRHVLYERYEEVFG